jgi:hypothetical protein
MIRYTTVILLLSMCRVVYTYEYLLSLTELVSDILFALRRTRSEDAHPVFILIKMKLKVMGTGPSVRWP